jgi:hypothetical protein
MLDETSFNALGLSDAHLTRLEWIEGGRDLAVGLTHAKGRGLTLICGRAHALNIQLITPEQHGAFPLTWAASLEKAGPGWRLNLDFAARGSIDLLCSGVSVGPQA